MNQRFIDKNWFFPRVSHETIDDMTSIHIAKNVVFNERTKYIEVNCHIVHKKLEKKIIVAKHVTS